MFWERKDMKSPPLQQQLKKKLVTLRSKPEPLSCALSKFLANSFERENRNFLDRLKRRGLQIKVHRRDHQSVKP
jgi:hypothetical protein